jgi:FxsC-like protein
MQFFQDLSAEVRVLAGLSSTHEVGFMDVHSIEIGASWPAELVQAISRCSTFLALCSPRYFVSTTCGREWQLFTERIRATEPHAGYQSATHGHLLPVFWLPLRQPPAAMTALVSDTDMLNETYRRSGLRQLLRLQRNRDDYLDTLTVLADRIVANASARRLAPAPDLHFDEIEDAFRTPPTRPASSSPDSATTETSEFIWFVIAAGSRSEIAAIRHGVQHYGDRPRDWAPYLSSSARPLAEEAAMVAADQGLRSAVVTVDELEECLDSARRRNQIVVLLVDPWSLQIQHIRAALGGHDLLSEPTTAVFVVVSHDDPETTDRSDELISQVRSTVILDDHHSDDVMFRSSVLSAAAFRADLSVVIEIARNRLFVEGTVFRRPAEGTPTRARPILMGP